jgi:hypothetical protein
MVVYAWRKNCKRVCKIYLHHYSLISLYSRFHRIMSSGTDLIYNVLIYILINNFVHLTSSFSW